jgi:small subunit ribosomal protein S16
MLEAAGARPKAARANLKSGVPGKAMAERAAKKAARAAEPAAE